MYFYWYMFEDVFSRKLVANEVYAQESSGLAANLLARACLSEQTAGRPLVLHSDNGSAMRVATMLARMQHLGVAPSFSRPRVSNDNAYAESLFRTVKYCPMRPEKAFETLDEARGWVEQFVAWYNQQHQHSGLKYVAPEQRHRGEALELLGQRDRLYHQARARHPRRWSGKTRDWTLASTVYLNPERPRGDDAHPGYFTADSRVRPLALPGLRHWTHDEFELSSGEAIPSKVTSPPCSTARFDLREGTALCAPAYEPVAKFPVKRSRMA